MAPHSTLDQRVYEELRKRLVDRTRRNRLLHFRPTTKAAAVRIVDVAPDRVLAHLQNDGRLVFRPLPDPDGEPTDEGTPQFHAALAAARITDDVYRGALAGLDTDDPSAAAKELRIERELRDQVRAQLGLPPRPQRRSIDLAAYARSHGVEPAFDLAPPRRPAVAHPACDRIQTLLFPDQLRARLSSLARKAREVEQETGVTTLHVAFGLLEWFEADASDAAFSSPLLLLPVGFERRTLRGEEDFRLVALDDAPTTNLSLELRLRDDFRLVLPAFDAYATDPVEQYIVAVAEAVRDRKRWRVRRFLTLAPFSFARIAMYRDLDPANWAFRGAEGPAAHPLVRPLLRGADETGATPSTGTFAEEYEIDDPEVERIAPVLVHDADSSQHSAIIDAMNGRNLVIEGPPGTGKSQTIANLIANVLHRGGTVLFVSEKMAALDVVKSRLDRVGLGPFCLALHAAGAKPSAVIEALRDREAQAAPRDVAAAGDAHVRRIRSELQAHLEAMHAEVGPLGETVHALVGRLAELGRLLPQLPGLLRSRAIELPDEIDAAAVTVARERLEALDAASVASERPDWNPRASPFRALERTDLFPDEQAALLEASAALARCCEPLRAAAAGPAGLLVGDAPDTSLAVVRCVVADIDGLVDPEPNVDLGLLARMLTLEAVEDGLWTACMASSAQDAAARLRAVGVQNPAALQAEPLMIALRFAGPLGVAGCRVEDVPRRAQAAAAEAEASGTHARTISALAGLLALEPDPEVGALRLACFAARLAAEADPAWQAHRRPGLEHYVELLDEAAGQQEAVKLRLSQISARMNIDGVSHTDLRAAASVLGERALLAFLRSDVRQARRLFVVRWRGGPRPRRTEWRVHLSDAADALAEEESLRTSPGLRSALGDASDPRSMNLKGIASAARWQRRVRDALAAAQVESMEFGSTLVAASPDWLHRLAALARPACALLAFLDRKNAPENQRWSALRSQEAARAAALAELAQALAEADLHGEVLMAELNGVASVRDQWCAAVSALMSPRAQALLAGAAPVPGTLRATGEFAASVFRKVPKAAAFVLADGWTDRIAGLRADAARAREAVAAMERNLRRLGPLGLTEFERAAEQQLTGTLRQHADSFTAAGGELALYLRFATVQAACLADPLARSILRAFEAASAPLQHMPEALDWLVAWAVVRRRAEADRAVFSRTGEQLSTLRQHFAAADRDRVRADARAVAAALLQRRVQPGSSAGSKREWTNGALLQNEFGKQRWHVPVRDLLARAADAVLALTPCLMMSPLTVAQYLKPGSIAFDLLVMDEASQIKPEDAMGAMLRGRQVVVVGDPKQLPPTSFFDRAIDGADDEEEDEGGERFSAEDRVAAESVLDLATRAFRPARRLRWHYRSQHESLIAFSNREFYGDQLVVFPAARAASETLGIELVRVDGRWRERVNIEEAKAVARAVADFMRRHPDLSHGIVAMNQPQRELIEAEINLLTADDAASAAYRDDWDKRLEPPFVKNLENVQGDERDVVFVSLGWGRTPEGAMHQRFFPVNRRGDGHRRLNVLFTRAKRKMVLFASLGPEDILVDPERTATGVRVLRDYLAYARDGRLEQGSEGNGEADSPFETSVANALRARGHEVALQVGVAGYRIDVAARDPAERGRFVLGIECDGAAYHSAKSARDRDRLRQEALERLGWRLTRVWSTDWFRDPGGQADRLSAEIVRAAALDGRGGCERARLVNAPAASPTSSQRVPPTNALLAQPAARPREAGAEPELAGAPAPNETATKATHDEELPRMASGVADVLRLFRDDVIMRDLPGSEPNRCILREEVLRVIVGSRLDDPADFHGKVPPRLRAATDGRQVRYIGRICEIVAEHGSAT